MSVIDGGTQYSSTLATEKKKLFNLCICNYYHNQTQMQRN